MYAGCVCVCCVTVMYNVWYVMCVCCVCVWYSMGVWCGVCGVFVQCVYVCVVCVGCVWCGVCVVCGEVCGVWCVIVMYNVWNTVCVWCGVYEWGKCVYIFLYASIQPGAIVLTHPMFLQGQNTHKQTKFTLSSNVLWIYPLCWEKLKF